MATKQELEQELALAREQLGQLSRSAEPTSQNMGDMLMGELQQLKKKSGQRDRGAIPIPFRVIDDHKNIPLYTELNKVIGPLSADNARTTMERFYEAGYPLFLKPRTPEQIEAYKKTDRFKVREAKRQATRERIRNKKPAVQIEKFARMVARETGKTVSEEMALPQRG